MKVTKRICKFVVNIKMEFIIILRFMSRKFVSSKFFEKEWWISINFVYNFIEILNIKLYQPFMKNLIWKSNVITKKSQQFLCD